MKRLENVEKNGKGNIKFSIRSWNAAIDDIRNSVPSPFVLFELESEGCIGVM